MASSPPFRPTSSKRSSSESGSSDSSSSSQAKRRDLRISPTDDESSTGSNSLRAGCKRPRDPRDFQEPLSSAKRSINATDALALIRQAFPNANFTTTKPGPSAVLDITSAPKVDTMDMVADARQAILSILEQRAVAEQQLILLQRLTAHQSNLASTNPSAAAGGPSKPGSKPNTVPNSTSSPGRAARALGSGMQAPSMGTAGTSVHRSLQDVINQVKNALAKTDPEPAPFAAPAIASTAKMNLNDLFGLPIVPSAPTGFPSLAVPDMSKSSAPPLYAPPPFSLGDGGIALAANAANFLNGLYPNSPYFPANALVTVSSAQPQPLKSAHPAPYLGNLSYPYSMSMSTFSSQPSAFSHPHGSMPTHHVAQAAASTQSHGASPFSLSNNSAHQLLYPISAAEFALSTAPSQSSPMPIVPCSTHALTASAKIDAVVAASSNRCTSPSSNLTSSPGCNGSSVPSPEGPHGTNSGMHEFSGKYDEEVSRLSPQRVVKHFPGLGVIPSAEAKLADAAKYASSVATMTHSHVSVQ